MREERTSLRLADGRELIYFDAKPGHDRGAYRDTRRLPDRAVASELRYDATRREWVAVAASRQGRPMLPGASECPLCPSSPGQLSEIPAPDYDVAVFENRFPSFGGQEGVVAVDDALSSAKPAAGRCEVVCFTAEHDTSFRRLSPQRVHLVLDALADRTAELSALGNVGQVFCFENRGKDIGVTLHHPHGQIYAYPFVPPVTTQMMEAARDHARRRGGNLFAEVLDAEAAAEVRVVARNSQWTAFVPVAARWPFEVHVYPHIQVPDLAELPGEYRASFGEVYLDVLARMDALFGFDVPYISGWYTAPAHADRMLGYAHLRIFSTQRAAHKLKYLAGSESAMGVFVNDVPPETAAQMLREVR